LRAVQQLGRLNVAAASQVEGAQNMQRVGIGIKSMERSIWGLIRKWHPGPIRTDAITDPFHPVEVGYYEYRIDKDLGVKNTPYLGSDTNDVLFGPGGYLYVSDGTAGLRVLKYTGRKEPGK
jgi:hypothetical protein